MSIVASIKAKITVLETEVMKLEGEAKVEVERLIAELKAEVEKL